MTWLVDLLQRITMSTAFHPLSGGNTWFWREAERIEWSNTKRLSDNRWLLSSGNFENVLRGPSIHSLLSPRFTFVELKLRIHSLYTWKLGVRKRNHWPKPSWTCATRSNDTFFFLIAFPLFYSIENQSFTDQSEWETLRHSKGETRGPYLHKAYNVFGEKEDSNTCINLQSVQDSPCWDSSMKCCESSGGKKKSIFTQKYTHSVYIATRALCHLHRIPG